MVIKIEAIKQKQKTVLWQARIDEFIMLENIKMS